MYTNPAQIYQPDTPGRHRYIRGAVARGRAANKQLREGRPRATTRGQPHLVVLQVQPQIVGGRAVDLCHQLPQVADRLAVHGLHLRRHAALQDLTAHGELSWPGSMAIYFMPRILHTRLRKRLPTCRLLTVTACWMSACQNCCSCARCAKTRAEEALWRACVLTSPSS